MSVSQQWPRDQAWVLREGHWERVWKSLCYQGLGEKKRPGRGILPMEDSGVQWSVDWRSNPILAFIHSFNDNICVELLVSDWHRSRPKDHDTEENGQSCVMTICRNVCSFQIYPRKGVGRNGWACEESVVSVTPLAHFPLSCNSTLLTGLNQPFLFLDQAGLENNRSALL